MSDKKKPKTTYMATCTNGTVMSACPGAKEGKRLQEMANMKIKQKYEFEEFFLFKLWSRFPFYTQ